MENLIHSEDSQFISITDEDAKQKVKKLLAEKKITLKVINRFTRYSESQLSEVLNDKYNGGNVEDLEKAITRFYRDWIAKFGIVETENVQMIDTTMRIAWLRFEIASVTGRFGIGKTVAAQRYVALNPDTAVYVSMTSTTSKVSLLHKLADTLNVSAQMSGSTDDKLQSIIRNLQRKPRLIAIDEADELRPQTMAILRDIHGGETAQRCAIVLFGTEKGLDNLLKDPLLGYLESRRGIIRTANEWDKKDARKVVNLWAHNLDKEDVDKAIAWAMNKHAGRSLYKLFARAYDVMIIEKKNKIDYECIEEAYMWLGVPQEKKK